MYFEWIRRHRRNLGIPLVLAALFLARFEQRYFVTSLFLVTTGEVLRVWAAGHLCKEKILTTGGPYRFTRNPLYLGSFLIAAGFCLVAGSLWIWLLTLLYFLLCYIPVIRHEETLLRQKFSNDFLAYASAVPAFYPQIKRYPVATTTFSFRQAIRNKEYNALLGIILAYVFLFFH